jgi:hypothetical protein
MTSLVGIPTGPQKSGIEWVTICANNVLPLRCSNDGWDPGVARVLDPSAAGIWVSAPPQLAPSDAFT